MKDRPHAAAVTLTFWMAPWGALSVYSPAHWRRFIYLSTSAECWMLTIVASSTVSPQIELDSQAFYAALWVLTR